MKRIIALLPMKGHSERVPNKNVKLFNGKPLFHIVLKKLQSSKYIQQIVVNTDGDAIKESILNNFPEVIVHDRPLGIQGDFVSMNEIINYDLQNSDADIYIQTHSTSPLLNIESVDNALEEFMTQSVYDSLFSVTKLQTRLYWGDSTPVNHNPNELLRTQDLPAVYEENSNFYIFTKKSFADSKNKRIGIKPMMYSIDKIEAVDIDNMQDFEIAEMLYKLKNELV